MFSSFVDVISSSGGLIKTENGMIYNINFFLRNSAKETGISSWSKVVEGVQNCREKKNVADDVLANILKHCSNQSRARLITCITMALWGRGRSLLAG